MVISKMKSKALIFFTVLFTLSTHIPVYATVAQRIPVLLYHHILSEKEYSGDNAFVLKAESFRSQMQFLYDNGYRTITEDDMYRFLYKKENLPEKSFMIHFDDGYYSNIIYAYPILKELGFTATVFLITDLTKDSDEGLNKDSYITKKCMEDTADVFTFSSHTHAMHKKEDGATVLERSSKENIIEDLRQSLKIVDNTFSFAYPHGRYNQAVIDALKGAGIQMAYAITRGYVTQGSNPFALNRFTVYRETALSEVRRFVLREYR